MARFPLKAALLTLPLLVSGIAPAMADLRVISRVGVWTASMGPSTNGTPMCLLETSGSGGRMLMLKYFKGARRLLIHMFKSSWNIPAGVNIPVILRVDGLPGWNADAGAVPSMPSGLQWGIGSDTIRDFAASFRAGQFMTVAFPQGSEPEWVIRLDGSSVTLSAFADCMRMLNGEATQPYASGSGATQPHAGGAGPAPRPGDTYVPGAPLATGRN